MIHDVLESIPPQAMTRFHWDGGKEPDRRKRDGLEEPLFGTPQHQEIFEVILDAHSDGVAIDLPILWTRLKDLGRAESIGLAFIGSLMDGFMTSLFVCDYMRVIVEKWRLRMVLKLSRLAETLIAQGDESSSIMAEVQSRLLALQESALKSAQVSAGDSACDTVIEIEQRAVTPGGIIGVPLGIPILDEMTGGVRNSTLTYIASRPSVGKSAMLRQVANYNAIDRADPIPTLFFSLEMSATEMNEFILAWVAGVPHWKIRKNMLGPADRDSLARAANRLNKAPLWFDYGSGLDINAIRARAMTAKMKRPDLGLVIVDYVQYIRGNPKLQPLDALNEISKGLKQLSREMAIPIIAAAQIKRLDGGDEKQPSLHDLKGTGNLEQDADYAIILHRDKKDQTGETTADLAKQRSGRTGEVTLWFDREYIYFRDKSQPMEQVI